MKLGHTVVTLLVAASCFATMLAPASAQRDHDYRHGYDHTAWQREHASQWRSWQASHHHTLTWRYYNRQWWPGYWGPHHVWVRVEL